MRHASHIHVRRQRQGWLWLLIYLDQPEASGWERTKTLAYRQAHLAQRTLAAVLRPKPTRRPRPKGDEDGGE